MKKNNQVLYIERGLIDFDLKSLMLRCWVLRKQVIPLAAVFLVLIFALSFWAGRQYVSEGFMRAPRKFAEYNAEKAAFWDREALRRYLEENKRLDDASGRYLLNALSERFVQAHLQAVLSLSKDDLRYITDTKSTLETVGILGFSISFKDQLPQNAQARVQLMGDFIKDAMLNEDLRETIYTKLGETKGKKQLIDNQIIQRRLALVQATSRLEAARIIAGKYPEASKMEARQLLSTGNDRDSVRYLSPTAQLVGIETEIADLNSQLTLLERDAAQNALRNEFYERIEQRSRQLQSGNALLDEFVKIGQAVFKDKDLQDDRVREVYNQIMLVVEQMRTKHIAESRFVSGPTLPQERSGLSPLLLACLSLVGGSLLAGMIVLLLDKVRKSKAGVENAVFGNEIDREADLKPVRAA
ncbi:hypothetical protein [Ralstonia pseudosolanacearum]|uniref:hypothetical protein n=1 Tax=Ralstonia pseudosolanacearum TaxID=1310165 RepID=UPI0023DCBEBA|nr:hypothetical protein [Ralstonia pseudosolanacearum]